ncbi:MAG: PKD domain-containing protein [Methanoregula sp.]|jgi:PKD repeat protein
MMGRRGLTEGAVLQTPSYKKRGFWQIGQSTLVKPVIAGLLLIILGALFIPSCAAVSTPVASFVSTVTTGTTPLTVQFLDSSTNSPTSWSWSFGDGGTSALQNPSHTYATAGTYTVTLTATNTDGSNTVTKIGYITVTYAIPVAGFTSNVTSGATPLYVQFTDISTYTPTSWSWTFGDGGTATTQSPIYEYTDEGTYTVSLTATNSAGSNTTYSTGYITVESIVFPVVSFSADVKYGTIPLTVQFTDTSSYTPTSCGWSFGDGSSSTEENPVHTYTTAGSYSVTHTATNAGGSRTLTSSNYITASSVTTVPTTMATISTTATTTMTAATPAATVAGEVTTTADSASDSSSIFYIIVGIFVIVVIGIAALFFFRRPPGGRHGSWDRQL